MGKADILCSKGEIMTETYKDFMENQDKVRKLLFKILKLDPKPLHMVAKEIGISKVTLFRFLKDEQDVDFVRLTKIENWIEMKSSACCQKD